MKKVMLIVNPVAGKLRSRETLFGIIDELNRCDVIPSVYFTKEREHAKALAILAAKDYVAGRLDAVICTGGDGTLNEVTSGLCSVGSRMPVGYIPAGTTNDFANGLGLPLDPPFAASAAARALRRGVTLPYDIGLFGKDRYFNYIASFGAFSAPSFATSQAAKNSIGYMAYVMEGVRDFFSIKPIPVICTSSDGSRYNMDVAFGAVSNTRTVGGLLHLDGAEVDMSDGLFEVMLVRMPQNPNDLNKIVTAVMTGDPQSCDMISFFRTDRVTFELPKGTQWTLDGEQATGGGVFDIVNLPRAVRLLKL